MVKRSAMRAGMGLLCCLLLATTAAEPADIVGYWELVGEKYDLQIEFKPNGSYVAQTAVGQMIGRWQLVAPGKIATWSSEAQPRRVSDYRVEGDRLVIIDSRGVELAHRRIDIARP